MLLDDYITAGKPLIYVNGFHFPSDDPSEDLVGHPLDERSGSHGSG
jgi:hypothetical protein